MCEALGYINIVEMISNMKKLNNYIKLGLLFNVIFIIGNYTDIFPEFIKGFLVGFGLTLIFIGIYSENHDISKLKNYKKCMLNKVLLKKK